MKYRWLLPAACLLMIGGFVFAQGNEGVPGPRAHIPYDSYEFQAAPEGQEIVHDFAVRNIGTALLHILKVEPG